MEIQYTNIRDEVSIDRAGQSVTQRRVEFYIGNHGPFVERFAREATSTDIDSRIRQLHSTLLALPSSM